MSPARWRSSGRTHLLAALGGPVERPYADNLRASRLVATTVATTRHTRRTVTVVESDGTTTAFNEAGSAMPDQEWPTCARHWTPSSTPATSEGAAANEYGRP